MNAVAPSATPEVTPEQLPVLTADMLARAGACEGAVEVFREAWPVGAPVTVENYLYCTVVLGLPMGWGATLFGPTRVRRQFQLETLAAWRDQRLERAEALAELGARAEGRPWQEWEVAQSVALAPVNRRYTQRVAEAFVSALVATMRAGGRPWLHPKKDPSDHDGSDVLFS